MAADETHRLQKWVLEHTKGTCPACSAESWLTDDYTVLTPYTEQRMEGFGPDFVVLVCVGCGYSRFHSVRILEQLAGSVT